MAHETSAAVSNKVIRICIPASDEVDKTVKMNTDMLAHGGLLKKINLKLSF